MRDLVADLKETFGSSLLLLVWLCITGVVSYSGPFGTYMALDLPARVAYWGIVVAVSIFVGCSVRLVVEHFFPSFHRITQTLAHALIMMIVLAPVLFYGSRAFMDEYRDQIPSLKALALTVFFVALAINTIRNLWISSQAVPEQVDEARLLARIEPELRGRILRLCAGDHYVEVYTERGSTKLRMRFSDALSELNGTPGMRVHRSHWVARDAIAGHMIEKGRMFLQLEDGALVPVSRNYRTEVEESGALNA